MSVQFRYNEPFFPSCFHRIYLIFRIFITFSFYPVNPVDPVKVLRSVRLSCKRFDVVNKYGLFCLRSILNIPFKTNFHALALQFVFSPCGVIIEIILPYQMVQLIDKCRFFFVFHACFSFPHGSMRTRGVKLKKIDYKALSICQPF